jgi:hypothetical protein
MGNIYVNQTKLVIELTTDRDLTVPTEVRLYYRKPGGTVGYVAPTAIVGAGNEIISWSSPTTPLLDESGIWRMWPWADYAGYILFGNAAVFKVHDVGM